MTTNKLKLDELYMLECLTLARKGAGFVSPNPMVGVVIVKNGKVIARGYHKKFGKPHAEVDAINSAKKSVKGSTLYVNLEPCNFYGKTPPCTDLIIQSEIKKVIVGTLDPNPKVSGKGIQQLRKTGIEVKVGVLENECKTLNEVYIKYITTKLPFVTLKIAQTLNGKTADHKGNSKWISSLESRKYVHKLRSEYDAVLVGAKTILLDNPELNVRLINGRNPKRIILDSNFTISEKSKVVSTANDGEILVITSKSEYHKKINKVKQFEKIGVKVIPIKSKYERVPILKVLQELFKHKIASVLVEGGSEIFSQFIESKLTDKILIFISPKILGSGLNSFTASKKVLINNSIKLKQTSIRKIDEDFLFEAYLK